MSYNLQHIPYQSKVELLQCLRELKAFATTMDAVWQSWHGKSPLNDPVELVDSPPKKRQRIEEVVLSPQPLPGRGNARLPASRSHGLPQARRPVSPLKPSAAPVSSGKTAEEAIMVDSDADEDLPPTPEDRSPAEYLFKLDTQLAPPHSFVPPDTVQHKRSAGLASPSSGSSALPSPALLRPFTYTPRKTYSGGLPSASMPVNGKQPEVVSLRQRVEEFFESGEKTSMNERMKMFMNTEGLNALNPYSPGFDLLDLVPDAFLQRPLELPPLDQQPSQTPNSDHADASASPARPHTTGAEAHQQGRRRLSQQTRIPQDQITKMMMPMVRMLEECDRLANDDPIPRLALHLLNAGLSIDSIASLSRVELHDIMTTELSPELLGAGILVVKWLAKQHNLPEWPPAFSQEETGRIRAEPMLLNMLALLHPLLNSWQVVDFRRRIEADWQRMRPPAVVYGEHMAFLRDLEEMRGVELTLAERAIFWHRTVAWSVSLWRAP